MKTIIVSKNQGNHEKSSIKSFASIADAKRNGYHCSDKYFFLDTKKDFMITEHIYTSQDMREQAEYKTLVRNSSEVRIFSDAKFIEIFPVQSDMYEVPSMLQHEREITI